MTVNNVLLLTVDRPNETSCKTNGRIIVSGSSGYLSNLASPAHPTARPPSSVIKGSIRAVPGSESCPWTIVVRPGQTVALRVIVLPFDGIDNNSDGPPRKASEYNPSGVGYGCAASFVIREPPLPLSEAGRRGDVEVTGRLRHHYSVCARNSRERHLYTSAGNAVSIHVTSTRFISRSHVSRVPAALRNSIPRFIINYEGIYMRANNLYNVA